jgi:hypothetical protein
MVLTQPKVAKETQQIEVELETSASEKRVKIRVQSYDERLGWYTAGSLSLPLHQLPLLEQAIEEMRTQAACESSDKIIPFPSELVPLG